MKYETNSTITPNISSWWKGFWDSTGNFFAKLVPVRSSLGIARHLGSQIPSVTIDSKKIFLSRMQQSAPYLVSEDRCVAVAPTKKAGKAHKKKSTLATRSKKSAVKTRRKSR